MVGNLNIFGVLVKHRIIKYMNDDLLTDIYIYIYNSPYYPYCTQLSRLGYVYWSRWSGYIADHLGGHQ